MEKKTTDFTLPPPLLLRKDSHYLHRLHCQEKPQYCFSQISTYIYIQVIQIVVAVRIMTCLQREVDMVGGIREFSVVSQVWFLMIMVIIFKMTTKVH